MRLTTLEIKGFKSFADKTTLHFKDDVTGIVGPNGCGKSNVVDAIRWVLGEQKSSHLRTEKMENLIFNGTKSRKASSLAEVHLTFENTRNLLPTEFNTVTISRHYFRSGDSEYRLNNVTCRLKDIVSLFLDTGVSSDSYSIIELNMLNDLLHDKDNSRRQLFEQAAGISKYKIRKKESLSKLNLTQNDLDRVEDLLFEIENNLKELERQARKAKRYRKLKEEYRDLSVELSIILLQSQKAAYQNISKQEEQENERRLGIDTSIQKVEARLQEEKNINLQKEKSLSEQQKIVNQHLAIVQKTENDKNVLSERLRYLGERRENITHQINTAISNIESIHERLNSLTVKEEKEAAKLKEVSDQLDLLEANLKAIRSKHDEVKSGYEAKQSEYKAIERSLFDMEKRIEINQVRIDNNQGALQNMASEEKENEGRIKDLESKKIQLEQSVKELTEELEKKNTGEQNLQESIRDLIDRLEEEKAGVALISRELDARNNEYKLTKNLVENLEGYPDSIKYLRKHVEYTREAPLLSDILNCPDEYKPAIESYLDPYLNHYVVDDLSQAVKSVQQLSEQDKGRANFFILSAFDKNGQQANAKAPKGSVNAFSLMDTDKRYASLMEHLLHNVFIIDEAINTDGLIISLNGQNDEKAVLITRSGKVIKRKYSVSGGSVGVYKGKRLGRIKNLSELESRISALLKDEGDRKKSILAIEENIRELKGKTSRQSIEEAKQALNKANAELMTCNSRIQDLEQRLEGHQSKAAELQEQITSKQKENTELQAQLGSIRETVNKAQEELKQANAEYQDLSNRLSIASNNFNQENIRYHQQENILSSVKQEKHYQERQLEDNKKQLEVNSGLKDTTTKEIEEGEIKLKEMGDLLKAAYENKEKQEKLLETLEEAYYKSRAVINEIEEERRSLQKTKEQSDQVINTIKDKVNEFKLELSTIRERLRIEFGLDINEIIDREPGGEYSLEELNEKVERLKKRLENYGEINPMAEQAYEEMAKRYEFINSQKQDLVDARESLLETIKEIDDTATGKFLEAFETVRTNFINVFHSLFSPEDDCNLVLVNPENPLESKIDIIAKPKGKKPQLIDQLSGGEKALTAMALLFGLYLLKPAPFCILDEVDAPLDDTNISKFNNIIREFSDKSQFIIVTHNKRTMAEVDVIYGVTMQQAGVSSVVPVDFRNLN